jgi:hypothetical protein
MVLRAMVAEAQLLVGPFMPDRSKVMLKIKKDILQGGGSGVRLPHFIKLHSVEKLLKKEEAKVHQRL